MLTADEDKEKTFTKQVSLQHGWRTMNACSALSMSLLANGLCPLATQWIGDPKAVDRCNDLSQRPVMSWHASTASNRLSLDRRSLAEYSLRRGSGTEWLEFEFSHLLTRGQGTKRYQD